MNYTCIFFGCLFIAMGLIFAFGKGHIHLKAWKNMPQKEKDKIDILPLCRNIGEVIMLNGILFLTKGMWSGFRDHWFMCALVYVCNGCLVYRRWPGCLVHLKGPPI